jgi:hypothetical protein
VDDTKKVRTSFANGGLDPGRIAGAPPLDVKPLDLGSVTLEHLREAIAEVAGDDDGGLRIRPGHVRHRCFHPRCARARHGHREGPVAGAEGIGKSGPQTIHDVEQEWIEVAHDG